MVHRFILLVTLFRPETNFTPVFILLLHPKTSKREKGQKNKALQNTIQKTKDWATRTSPTCGGAMEE